MLVRAHLRGDPKKTAVLVLLAVVMAVVYARLFFIRGGPQEVAAADQAVVAASPATDPSVSASVTSPAEARVRLDRPLVRRLSRNPCVLGSEEPVDAPIEDGGSKYEASGPGSEQATIDLVLESTIVGPAPLASISGRVVRPGDEIEGFVLERVEPTRVVLRRHEIRVILLLR